MEENKTLKESYYLGPSSTFSWTNLERAQIDCTLPLVEMIGRSTLFDMASFGPQSNWILQQMNALIPRLFVDLCAMEAAKIIPIESFRLFQPPVSGKIDIFGGSSLGQRQRL